MLKLKKVKKVIEKIITLEELFATEAYKNDGKIFPHPQQLIHEFTNVVTTKFTNTNYILKVDKEGGAGTEADENILTWGRGLLMYKLESADVNYSPTIGIIWSYDTTKWAIKIFRGVNVHACTNYMVGGADDIYERLFKKTKGTGREAALLWKQECELVLANILDKTEDYVNTMDEMFKSTIQLVNDLKGTIYYDDDETGVCNQIQELIGRLYINDVINGLFDSSTFSEGCRLVFNKKHLHRNKDLYEMTTNNINLWQLYNAFTQRITDGGTIPIDLMPNKTLEVTQMLIKEIDIKLNN